LGDPARLIHPRPPATYPISRTRSSVRGTPMLPVSTPSLHSEHNKEPTSAGRSPHHRQEPLHTRSAPSSDRSDSSAAIGVVAASPPRWLQSTHNVPDG